MEIRKYNANILKQRRLRTRHLNPMFIGTITTTVQNPNILKIELHTSHNLITQHNVLDLIPVARGGGGVLRLLTQSLTLTLIFYSFLQCNVIDLRYFKPSSMHSELGTLEWWISRSMLDPLFFLISRLT